jgi:hypothetical protein
VTVSFFGCGGSSDEPGSANPSAPPSRSAQDTGRVPAAPMPDRETDPLKFTEWRVDQLILKQDADGDGRLDSVEFGDTPENNFQRIDANQDGFVTKQEILDDLIPKMRQAGDIP